MKTKFDAYMSFPADEYSFGTFDRLRKYLGSVEAIEQAFQIEFSCGDGKYLGDFWKWTDGGGGLFTEASDEELEKYDGRVCLETPPRFRTVKMSQVVEQMKTGKDYNFTIKYFPKKEEEVYYLNGKERSRKWVG